MAGKRTLAIAAIVAASAALAGCYQPVAPYDGAPYFGYYYGGVPFGGPIGGYQVYAAPWYLSGGHYGPEPGFSHPRYARRAAIRAGYAHY